MPRRDPSEFSRKTIETLAKRASQTCSNPDCLRPTSGPHSDNEKFITVGKAAHIKGQRPGGARYDHTMSEEQRGDISNSIWLCSVCHDLIDRDPQKYTIDLLNEWKVNHEKNVSMAMLNTLGFKNTSLAFMATAKIDVLEDENIKESLKAWANGDIKTAYHYSEEAYYNASGRVKLQAIVNMTLLSREEFTKVGYYTSLCDEGISLAKYLNEPAFTAVFKAHKAFFIEHRAFKDSLDILAEIEVKKATGLTSMSDSDRAKTMESLRKDSEAMDTLLNDALTEVYKSKDLSAIAHVKMMAANTVGMNFMLTSQLGGDTGKIEHFVIQNFVEAKQIYEKLGDKEGVATVLHNLANNLSVFGNHKRAQQYAEEALIIAKEIGYRELIDKATLLLQKKIDKNN